ncbi:phage holin family protein [Defluviimonas sp. WL0024]|uniref:Phage holin family protein n=1 Tax=Albidovulum salinarum TaxID=2984153 RepID=A0ABT2X907_9RHOB|nr:phage holin family protein [Defluviimonas sp. WL0024]MCU9850234.1 phage holin family protein [Defluviimonas sp. WL0024]
MNVEPSVKSTGALVGDALHQVTRLVRGEVALAKAEVAESVRTAGMGIVLVAAAAVIALSALNVLSAALVAALVDQGLAPGWSALLVALLLGTVALILALKGLHALKPSSLAPRRTVENVRRDAKTIKEIVENGTSD